MTRSSLRDARKLTDRIADLTKRSGAGADKALAEAYLRRALCFYSLGNRLRAMQDLQAAGLLGSEAALLWSRYDFRRDFGT